MMKVQIEDLILSVDTETGNKLLADKDYAKLYVTTVRQHLKNQSQESLEKTDLVDSQPSCSSSGNRSTMVWTSSKKQTPHDHEATLMLLQLRKKYDNEFTDDHTVKNTLWSKIAQELNDNGYFVGVGIEGREKCRIKFGNLQASFVKTNDRRRRTGEGAIKKPPYFDELWDILGDKHKYNPVHVMDSLKDDDPIPDENISEQQVTETTPKKGCMENRFNQVKRSVKPKSVKENVLTELLTIQKENQTAKKEEFKEFVRMFEDANKKRHEEMMALISAMQSKQNEKESKGKKRRISNDSD